MYSNAFSLKIMLDAVVNENLMNKRHEETPVIFLAYMLLIMVFPITVTASLTGSSTFSAFFWTQSSDTTVKNGCYGYSQVDSISTESNPNKYFSTFWLSKYSWWHKLFINEETFIKTTITINKGKPALIISAPDHFSTPETEWLTGIEHTGADSKDTIRFFFPLLPQTTDYGRYDYFSIDVNDSVDLEFYGAGDSIMVGTFVHKKPDSRGAVNILARNAFVVELTKSNPLRIKSIRCNGAYKTFIENYLCFDLDRLKSDALWYGIDITDTTSNVPRIKIHSIATAGKSRFITSDTPNISWKLYNPSYVDSCIVNVSFNNKKQWNPTGKTGADSSFIWTVPPVPQSVSAAQTSDSSILKVTAFGKQGERISSLSSLFSIVPPPEEFFFSAVSYSASSIIIAWNPSAIAETGKDAIWIAFRKDSPVNQIDSTVDTIRYGVAISSDTITGLNQSGTYYFSAFVKNQDGSFTLAGDNATDSAQAKDLTPPQNNFKLSGKSIDSSTIAISWQPDGTIDGDIDSIGIWFNEFNYPVEAYNSASKKAGIWNVNRSLDTIKNLLPDKLYYFALFVADKNGNWSAAPSSAQLEIRTSPANGKTSGTEIKLTGSTVQSIFSDTLKIWGDGLDATYTDTIDRWKAPSTSGFVPSGTAFTFRNGKIPTGTRLSFSVVYDIPDSPLTQKDIRIYRFNIYTGAWRLEATDLTFDTTHQAIRFSSDEIRLPFMLMIDTAAPVINGIKQDTSAYPVTKQIVDNFTITDNIENPSISLFAGSGDLGYSNISLYVTRGTKTNSYVSTIPAYVADQCSGLRGLITVNDGRSSDTVNISRKIIRTTTNCDDASIKSRQWTPVPVTALPRDNSLSTVLKNALQISSFDYDTSRERIIRWLPDSSRWVQYRSSDKNNFSFTPGKLLWIKTREDLTVKFTNAVVPALIDTLKIQLKKKAWTDFSIPYNFDIYAGDIFSATALGNKKTDSIELYKWVKDNNSYKTEPEVMPGINVKSDPKTIFTGAGAYTAYNNDDTDRVLCIPPVCIALSNVGKSASKRSASTTQWSIKLGVSCNDGTNLSSIYCAGLPDSKQPRFYQAAPTFLPVSAKIIDQKTGKYYGHAASGDLSDGGEAFGIAYENLSDGTSVLTTTIEQTTGLPQGTGAVLFLTSTGAAGLPSSSSTISLPAKQKSTGYLIVGTSAFIDGYIKNLSSIFSFLPFTANHILKIHYSLPFGVKQIAVSIFDLKGRRVEQIIKNSGIHPGQGSLMINSRFSSGYYIVQMRAFKEDSDRPLVINKRWMFVR